MGQLGSNLGAKCVSPGSKNGHEVDALSSQSGPRACPLGRQKNFRVFAISWRAPWVNLGAIWELSASAQAAKMARKLTHLAPKAAPELARLARQKNFQVFTIIWRAPWVNLGTIWKLNASTWAPKMATELIHLALRSGPEFANG